MVTKLTVKSIFKNMIHEEIKAEKRPVFKVASFQVIFATMKSINNINYLYFQHTSKSSNKKRAWKSLKQILTAERALPWPEDYVHCNSLELLITSRNHYIMFSDSSINAPPTFKPVKKYSDISGLSVRVYI